MPTIGTVVIVTLSVGPSIQVMPSATGWEVLCYRAGRARRDNVEAEGTCSAWRNAHLLQLSRSGGG